jgi:hypothetical protein
MNRKVTKIGSAVALLAFIISSIPTVVGMLNAFNQASNIGQIDNEQLKDQIAFSLSWSMWFMPFIFIGIALATIGLFLPSQRKKTNAQPSTQGDAFGAP